MCLGTYPYLMMCGSLLESNNNYQSKSSRSRVWVHNYFLSAEYAVKSFVNNVPYYSTFSSGAKYGCCCIQQAVKLSHQQSGSKTGMY